jgi:UDP-N-acetylmuramyl pentapeptide synthase
MPRNWKEISLLLRSPLGRLRLLDAVRRRFWPRLRRLANYHLARLYRCTLVRNTRITAVVGSFGKSTTMRAVTVALGREVHPHALFNALSSLARAVLRIRPGDRYAVIEVGIGVPGQMARYARFSHC